MQAKISDAGDLSKLQSAICELQIALALTKNGKSVELLSDNPRGWTGKTPDIVAKDATFGEVFFEVKRISETEVCDLLMRWIKSMLVNQPLLIRATLSPFLSRPYTKKSDRSRQRRALYKS